MCEAADLANCMSVAGSFEGQQINRLHIAQAHTRSQSCNVTINLELSGHTRPMQELILPDVSYGSPLFSPPTQINVYTC